MTARIIRSFADRDLHQPKAMVQRARVVDIASVALRLSLRGRERQAFSMAVSHQSNHLRNMHSSPWPS